MGTRRVLVLILTLVGVGAIGTGVWGLPKGPYTSTRFPHKEHLGESLKDLRSVKGHVDKVL